MLHKVISIKNVGRFLNYSASGDVELKRYNLVFAENGRGKTTLCAILRSLQSGEPAYVLGRTALGTGGAAAIEVLLESGTVTFSEGAWSDAYPDLAIFDELFVSENVYSGNAVELDHKRNLYKVIVGKQGVELARDIEKLDAASRAKSTEIREKLAAVQAFVPQGLTVEAFLSFQEDPAIDAKIAEEEKELQAVKEADQIKKRAALSEVVLPTLPGSFETLLSKTIEAIAADAERRVARQIEAHGMHDRGETWLSEGVGYIRDNACPFCGQALEGVAALISAYNAYFSKAYNALRTEIGVLRQEIEEGFSDQQIAWIERSLDQNTDGLEFWSRYCEISVPALADGERVEGEGLRTVRQDALSLLDRKAAAPLEQVAEDVAFTEAKSILAKMQAEADTYNQAVQAANATIAARKATTAAADMNTVESALTLLRATKKRHEPEASEACLAYKASQDEKKALEVQKGDVKKKLDDYAKEVMGSYEQVINRLLDGFNAGFRITGSRHGYPGGVASASYQILINDAAVDLGNEMTPLGTPSFSNTLSSGDKSTLALTFFLAQLDSEADRATKIVVFDDPFNSQDSFRKDHTVQKIKECGDSCRQVIVLSHDQTFLRRIWDRLAPQAAGRRALQLARIGVRDTRISAWDIEEATQARFLTDRKALADYYNTGGGNPRDIVKKIRPVLETYCRYLYPGDFVDNTLGVIIGKIRAAGPTHQLFPLLNDLDSVNVYTRRYHHGENPNAATESISDTELQGFIKTTLEITGGC